MTRPTGPITAPVSVLDEPHVERSVLLLEEDEDEAFSFRELLDDAGGAWSVDWRGDAEAALEALVAGDYDVCVLSEGVDPSVGPQLIEAAQALLPRPPPFVFLAASTDPALGLQAIRRGAADVLAKEDLRPRLLVQTLTHAMTRRELRQCMRRDPLTGAHNRESLAERIEAAVARAARDGSVLAVCHLSLSGLEQGPGAAEGRLRWVYRQLDRAVRPYDVVARTDERSFAILLEGLEGLEDASVVVSRLEAAVERPHDDLAALEAAIGVAMYPRDGSDTVTLLRVAEAGVPRQEISEAGLPPPTDRDGVLAALAAREFGVVCQPQVDLQTGDLVAAEVLARWRPAAGRGAPIAEVVAAMEDAGTIAELDLWVLERATRLLEEMPTLPRVAVNVSPWTLKHPGFIERVESLLPREGGRLELELTEGVSVADESSFANTLHVLRQLGVRVALDDFGTGYSSFVRLQSLPCDTLKVDRRFVQGVDQTETDRAIVGAIAQLAHRMGCDVVMEGVETPRQEAILREMGNVKAQGFLYAAPVSETQLRRWVS